MIMLHLWPTGSPSGLCPFVNRNQRHRASVIETALDSKPHMSVCLPHKLYMRHTNLYPFILMHNIGQNSQKSESILRFSITINSANVKVYIKVPFLIHYCFYSNSSFTGNLYGRCSR